MGKVNCLKLDVLERKVFFCNMPGHVELKCWQKHGIPNWAKQLNDGPTLSNCVTCLYLLHDRSKVFTCFYQFLNEVKTQHSTMIKTFISDNALSYKSTSFRSLMKASGIIHETSCTHTPQKNGVS